MFPINLPTLVLRMENVATKRTGGLDMNSSATMNMDMKVKRADCADIGIIVEIRSRNLASSRYTDAFRLGN